MTSGRRLSATALATALLGLSTVQAALAVWLQLTSPVEPVVLSDVVFAVSMLAYATLGWLIIAKGPRNRLGWVYLVFPLLLAIAALVEEAGLRAALNGSDTLAAMLLIANVWLAYSGYLMLNGPAFVLFPDGRFPSKGFRRLFVATASAVLITVVAYTVSAEPLCVGRLGSEDCVRLLDNPLGLAPVNGLRQGSYDMLGYLLLLGGTFALLGAIARYRRSSSEVRQQIKWLAWLTAIGVPLILVFYGGQDFLGFPSLDGWNEVPWIAVVSVGGPIAMGIAIFKYRLYEIDRIISRTTTYTLLAAILAAVYVGGVALAQLVLPFRGPLGVVASTLAVAALFNPLRRRVQEAVDRRFNRSRYDAQRVLEDFSGRLRDDVDLEQVQAAVLRVALSALQPVHLSLWMRQPEGRKG